MVAPKFTKGDKVIFTGMVRFVSKQKGEAKSVKKGSYGVITKVEIKSAHFPRDIAYEIKLIPSGLYVHNVSESILGRALIRKAK